MYYEDSIRSGVGFIRTTSCFTPWDFDGPSNWRGTRLPNSIGADEMKTAIAAPSLDPISVLRELLWAYLYLRLRQDKIKYVYWEYSED